MAGIPKRIFKWFVIAILAVAVIFADIAILMKFFGKGALEKTISNLLGSDVKFRGIAIDLDKGALHFQGFTVLNTVEFENNIFNAEKFIVYINKEKFDKDKTFAFEEVYIQKGTLNIERNSRGQLNLNSAMKAELPSSPGLAYAAELPAIPAGGGLYKTISVIKKITIEDSVINFKDNYIPGTPFMITCDNFNLSFRAEATPESRTANIPATFQMNFRVPDKRYQPGTVSVSANMAVYTSRTDVEATLRTQFINLMQFRPYFERNTPFYFTSGLFSSDTSFRMHNNMIDSLTTMSFRDLNLNIKPGQENAQVFATAANRLLPYLKSQQGDVLFDFVIKGPSEKPALGLGPKVKFAIGMVALEEFSKAMQQLQKLRN